MSCPPHYELQPTLTEVTALFSFPKWKHDANRPQTNIPKTCMHCREVGESKILSPDIKAGRLMFVVPQPH